jgi:hypothetical protein
MRVSRYGYDNAQSALSIAQLAVEFARHIDRGSDGTGLLSYPAET